MVNPADFFCLEKLQLSEAWLNDKCIRHVELDHLDHEEDRFWKDLIEKYLYPLTHDRSYQDRMNADLLDLRNKFAFAFFMINALFVLIVFLLQLKKDCLHIEWPIGPLVNHTVVPCDSDSRDPIWVLSRLQLEPIGFVFLFFFMSLLLIQFLAMLMHRFGTLSHILASTELFCFRKPIDKLSEDEIVVQNAVEIARELQAIRGVDEDGTASVTDAQDETISRRRVVKNLESSRKSMMKKRTETLDAAFRKRFFALSVGETESGLINTAETPVLGFMGSGKRRLTMRKGTLRALEMRRNSVFGTLDQRNFGQTDKRGPSKRRLDKLFHGKNGSAEAQRGANGDEPLTASSSETSDDEQHFHKPTNGGGGRKAQDIKQDLEKSTSSVKKLIASTASSNVQNSPESRSGLLNQSRQSSTASNINVESHF